MKHLIFIFLASARGLPQLQETDRDVAEVVAVLEAQLPEDIKDSVYNTFQDVKNVIFTIGLFIIARFLYVLDSFILPLYWT